MDELELKSIWNAYDKKIERSLQLNIILLQNLQTDKAKSKLNALLSIKLTAVITGILWVLLLGALAYSNNLQNLYFTVSMIVLMLFGIVAIVAYFKHIILINRIDYTGNITDTQSKLAQLQVATINITRFLWLQMPFYTTFFWSKNWVNGDLGFWLIALPLTTAFTLLAIYLYKNITPENITKAWVKKLLMIGIEYKYALAASELLKEIEDFKKD